jgi:acetamidase/formamidase
MVFRITAMAAALSAVAAAQTGTTHTLVPQRFYNTFSFAHPPALRIKPGDRVVTKTIDAAGVDWNGQQVAQGPNPQTGPFFVEGAEPGDMLVVTFEKLELNRATAWSSSLLAPYAVDPASLIARTDRDARRVTWLLDKAGGIARLDGPEIGGIELRLRPMLGCVGVAPARKEAVATSTPGAFGGNMDYAGLNQGVEVMLPVYEPGALLFVGDGHALQGEGEVVGTGLETSMDVEFSVELRKKANLTGPRAETSEYIISIGSQPEFVSSTNRGLQLATSDMVNWLTTEHKVEPWAAHLLIGYQGEYEVVTVAGTIALKIPKRVLP